MSTDTTSTDVAVRTAGEVAERTPAQLLVAQIRGDDFKQQIAAALPPSVTPDRFVRATVTALMQNPDLVEATTDSIFSSVIRCAQDGLLPDGREAALVIFNSKVGNDWVKKAQYMPMIGGFRKIAAEHGWTIRTTVVYEHDEFSYQLGLEPRLVHQPARPGVDRGVRIAAYAIGVHRDGRKEIEVFIGAEVEQARQVSKAKDRGPWVDWTDRMWEKTVGRRLFAKLPLDPADTERIARMVAAEDLDPAAAAAAIYGPNATPALPPADGQPTEPLDAAATPTGGDGTSGGTVDQQASASAKPADVEAPGPDEFAGDEPTHNSHVAGTAANVKFTSGKYGPKAVDGDEHPGYTIHEVATDLADPNYVKWAANSWQSDPVKTACQIYAEEHLGGWRRDAA